MDVIALPGLPVFPRSAIGVELDQRLRHIAAMPDQPAPVITGCDNPQSRFIRARLAPLADPLAAYVPENLKKPVFQQRSGIEAEIGDALAPITRATLATSAEWQERLRDIASRVHRSDTAFRSTAIGTEPGYGGTIIAYPPAELVVPLLQMISREVSRRADAALCEIAAYVMLAFTTVHPFVVGNGQTARILFNLVLRSEYPALAYIGIKEVTQFSAGDFLIARNRVHFQKDWEPYLNWLLAIFDVHIAMRTGSENQGD